MQNLERKPGIWALPSRNCGRYMKRDKNIMQNGSKSIRKTRRRSPRANGFSIFVDTNILISAILFPDSRVAELVVHVQQHHQLWIAPHTLEETETVLRRYDSRMLRAWRAFYKAGLYRVGPIPSARMLAHFSDVVDPDDIPIVAPALTVHPDLFVTGDKRHLHVEVSVCICPWSRLQKHVGVFSYSGAKERLEYPSMKVHGSGMVSCATYCAVSRVGRDTVAGAPAPVLVTLVCHERRRYLQIQLQRLPSKSTLGESILGEYLHFIPNIIE